MENDIRPYFEILLECLIKNSHSYLLTKEFFNHRVKRFDAAHTVLMFLQKHNNSFMVKILTAKPNLSLTNEFLNAIVSVTTKDKNIPEKATYETEKNKLKSENVLGYLAYFILANDADSAAKTVLHLPDREISECKNTDIELNADSNKKQRLEEKNKAIQEKYENIKKQLAVANSQMKNLSDCNSKLQTENKSYSEKCNALLLEEAKLKSNNDKLVEQAHELEINREIEKTLNAEASQQFRTDIQKTSFGIVKSNQWGKYILRLADIERNEFIPFEPDEARPKRFDNRKHLSDDSLRHNDVEIDTVGIWNWTAAENYSDENKDYVNLKFRSDLRPVEIIDLHKGTEDVVHSLIYGFAYPHVHADQRYLVVISNNIQSVTAVALSGNMLTDEKGSYYLNKDIYALNKYTIDKADIHSFFEVDSRSFYMKTALEEPVGKLMTCTHAEAIANAIAKLATKEKLDEFHTARQQKHIIKSFLASINVDTVCENLRLDYNWTSEKAKAYVAKYADDVAKYLNGEDADTALFTYIVEHNVSMTQRYEARIDERWKKENDEKVKTAAAEIEKLNQKVTNLQHQRDEIGLELGVKEKKVRALDEQLKHAEEVGNKAQHIVKEKIQSARKDASEFLAQMAFCFLPDRQTEATDIKRNLYTSGRALDKDKIFKQKDINGVIESISWNFEKVGVKEELSHPLASYFLAACFERIPLLLAGPAASELSDAFSAGLTGNLAARLVCTDAWDENAAKQAIDSEDEIIKVENPFSAHWIDRLPQTVWSSDKLFLYMTPYKEDLAIEPIGLYNYMLPLFTEDLIGQPFDKLDYCGSKWNGENPQQSTDRKSVV